MNITLNGGATELPDGTCLEELLAAQPHHDSRRRGIAIARNGEVVPRGRWTTEQLADGDVIELLTATQGG